MIITANIYSLTDGFFEALRLSVFQVSSIITTAGFSTADFNLWPTLSKSIWFLNWAKNTTKSKSKKLKKKKFITVDYQ